MWPTGFRRASPNDYPGCNDSANSSMEIERDFIELLELLNSHHVEYLLVGAYARAFYGAPRFTGDLDVFVKPATTNAERLMAALTDFGLVQLGCPKETPRNRC